MKAVFLCALFLVLIKPCFADENNKTVEFVLNELHRHASEANFDAYFNVYHDDAIFIGTDASEVWTKDAFMQYAKPHFDKGTGWTYIPTTRHVYFSPNEDVAWFDELLHNEKLGETRGTGVLVKEGNTWKVSQYHLTIPIPNSIASDVAEQIKALSQKQ